MGTGREKAIIPFDEMYKYKYDLELSSTEKKMVIYALLMGNLSLTRKISSWKETTQGSSLQDIQVSHAFRECNQTQMKLLLLALANLYLVGVLLD